MDAFISDKEKTSIVQFFRVDESRPKIVIDLGVAQSSKGVPQGTVLGPFGFSTHDNNISLSTA